MGRFSSAADVAFLFVYSFGFTWKTSCLDTRVYFTLEWLDANSRHSLLPVVRVSKPIVYTRGLFTFKGTFGRANFLLFHATFISLTIISSDRIHAFSLKLFGSLREYSDRLGKPHWDRHVDCCCIFPQSITQTSAFSPCRLADGSWPGPPHWHPTQGVFRNVMDLLVTFCWHLRDPCSLLIFSTTFTEAFWKADSLPHTSRLWTPLGKQTGLSLFNKRPPTPNSCPVFLLSTCTC